MVSAYSCAACLQGIKVMWVAAGPAAFHSVIGTDDGRCFTWGRNEVPPTFKPMTACMSNALHLCHDPCNISSDVQGVTRLGRSFLQGNDTTPSWHMCGASAQPCLTGCGSLAAAQPAAHPLTTIDAALTLSVLCPQKGQLGHGDLQQRNAPTEVTYLAGLFIAAGACGKSHTAVAARSGEAYTWGSNLVVRRLLPRDP